MLIDTHTHLYSNQFDDDREERIKAALDLGVERFLLPNIDLDSVEGMLLLSRKYADQCFPMMGLHPCSVKQDFEKVLDKMDGLFAKHKFIAVGEIGIDLYWDKSLLKEQQAAFRRQIKWAKAKKLPIVIHCREAFDEILQILDELNDANLSGVFHCFTGNLQQAKHILNYRNFKLGIGGVLTFKNAGLDKVLAELAPADIVLETDSPYLAPTPFRGKRNESAYLPRIAEKVAEVFQLSVREISEITTHNAIEIFKLNE